MVRTPIGEALTVGELIKLLEQYPGDMPVADYGLDPMTKVGVRTWVHNNHPYDLPDTDFIVIE